MTHSDRYDLPISTASDAAAAAYREGIDLMLSAWPGATAMFERAMAADPDFALAHAALARARFVNADPTGAKAAIAAAQGLVARRGTEREQSHVAILALSMAGQPVQCLAQTLAHLDRWPRDAVVMGLPLGAFGLYAFSGMAEHDQARVDLCERHARHYGDDWWFQGYRGWSHTENHAVALGRDLTERSLGQRRANANAAHSLAHALFEDGSAADSERFIADWLPLYERQGMLYGHIWWHRALLALEQDDAAGALAIYDAQIKPGAHTGVPLNAFTDFASFLWRLRLAGHAVPAGAWVDVAAYAAQNFPKAGIAFADVHVGYVAAATGNAGLCGQRVHELDARLANGQLAAGPVAPAICRAATAFAEGDYRRCVAVLEPLAGDVVRIGGSHAQREAIEDMLLLALMHCGESHKARALLDTRLHRRPSARDGRWRAGLGAG